MCDWLTSAFVQTQSRVLVST